MTAKAQKILDTSIRLFLRDGVKKVTMDEIAEAAKASKVTIYKYFTDKDTLYLHAGRHMLEEHMRALAAAAAPGAPLRHRFYAALDAVSAFADDGMFALCRELAEYNHAVDAELAAYRQASQDVLCALITEGIGAGYIRGDLSRDMIYHYIDMGITYYQQNEEYRRKLRTDGDFRSRFMLFFVGNIFVDGAAILPDT